MRLRCRFWLPVTLVWQHECLQPGLAGVAVANTQRCIWVFSKRDVSLSYVPSAA